MSLVKPHGFFNQFLEFGTFRITLTFCRFILSARKPFRTQTHPPSNGGGREKLCRPGSLWRPQHLTNGEGARGWFAKAIGAAPPPRIGPEVVGYEFSGDLAASTRYKDLERFQGFFLNLSRKMHRFSTPYDFKPSQGVDFECPGPPLAIGGAGDRA